MSQAGDYIKYKKRRIRRKNIRKIAKQERIETQRRQRLERKNRVESNNGPNCPRCNKPMMTYRHKQITEKELAKKYYYSEWYRCWNDKCRTDVVTLDEFKVYVHPDPEPYRVIP